MKTINPMVKISATSLLVFLCCKRFPKSKIYKRIQKEFAEFKKTVQKPSIKVLLAFVIALLLVIAFSNKIVDRDNIIYTPTEFGYLSLDRRSKVIKYISDDLVSVFENLNSDNLYKLFKEEPMSAENLNYIYVLTNLYGDKFSFRLFKLLVNIHLTGSYKLFNGFWFWLYKVLKKLGLRKRDLTQEEILFLYTQFIQRYYKKTAKPVRG